MNLDWDTEFTKLKQTALAIRDDRNALLYALRHLVGVIEAAGLLNLSRGVQLGETVWYVKASDAMEQAKSAIAQADAR